MLRSRHFPIMVVEGFRGAGKTALLSELAAQIDQRMPYAGWKDATPQPPTVEDEMLGRLLEDLATPTFPDLVTCTDSRRRHLHWQVAADHADVSRHCPDGSHAVFLEAERRHHREAEWWD